MFEFLSSQRRVVELSGHLINLDDVEAALREDPSVESCVVLIRQSDRSTSELVPYLVSVGVLCLQRLNSYLHPILPSELLPKTYVPIAALPLTPDGGVDEGALARLAVIDADLVRRWEDRVKRLSDVEQISVQVHTHARKRPLLRLSDLLPDWKTIHGGMQTPMTRMNRASSQESRADSDRFARVDGAFQDYAGARPHTLPNWFYQPIWRRKAINGWRSLRHWRGICLIFLDPSGLGEFLCAELDKLNQPCIGVEAGTTFAQKSPTQYQIDPQNPDHYRQLWSALNVDDVQVDRILHLWTYGFYKGEISSLETLEQAQTQGLYSLMCLAQTLGRASSLTQRPVRLLTVSSYAQAVIPEDAIAYEKSPLLGLLKTIPQEIPGLHCSHLDLPFNPVEVNAGYILQELWAACVDPEVAYRYGQRLIPRLQPVCLIQESPQALPFRRDGMYLITEGLSDIGVTIAQYLLQHCQAKVLLVGRTPLPERQDWASHLARSSQISGKIKAYLALERLGGELSYEPVDICDFSQLQQCVTQAAAAWSCELDGVIHLAELHQEQSLIDETTASLTQALHHQVMGAWRLPQLLSDPAKGVFICFASVHGLLGGVQAAAVAAASRFLSSFCAYQQCRRGLQSYYLAWSIWASGGVGRSYGREPVAGDRSYYGLHRQQGLYSFLAALQHDYAQLLIGLDSSNPHIRRYVETSLPQAQTLCAYVASRAPNVSLAKLQSLSIKDRFGQLTTCEIRQVQAIPGRGSNGVDRFSGDRPERTVPNRSLERQVAGL